MKTITIQIKDETAEALDRVVNMQQFYEYPMGQAYSLIIDELVRDIPAWCFYVRKMKNKRMKTKKTKRCILCNRTMYWWQPTWYGVSHFKCAIRAIEEKALQAKPSRLNSKHSSGVWASWRDLVDFERAIEKMRKAMKWFIKKRKNHICSVSRKRLLSFPFFFILVCTLIL